MLFSTDEMVVLFRYQCLVEATMQKERLLSLMEFSKGLRLLYVEDNDEVRMMTSRLFAHFFKDITLCADGKEGLETFQSHDFDLIITDIDMPVMSGSEMIEHIRLEDTVTPILVFSAQDKPEGLEQEINGFIQKPMQQLKFIELLEYTVRYIILKQKLDLQQKMYRGAFQDDIRYTGTYL